MNLPGEGDSMSAVAAPITEAMPSGKYGQADTGYLYPTHHCFDDALDFIVAVLPNDPQLRHTLRLVHGICLSPDGEPYVHAWVEEGPRCISRGIRAGETIYYQAERADFYAELRVQERTRYTVQAALRQNRRHGTYGPWKARYLALCTPAHNAAPRPPEVG
jgi:hypothetical protein